MREMFCADWAFGIKGAIENNVRENYPEYLRSWPLLSTFNSECYELEEKYVVVLLRDKLSGMPSGPSTPKPFPYDDHPKLPVSYQDAPSWQEYLHSKFSLKPEDAAMILPIHDSGKNDARADFDLFTTEEKALWHVQLDQIIAHQKDRIVPQDTGSPGASGSAVYNISGTNNRVIINAHDESVNIVENTTVFESLRGAAWEGISDLGEQKRVLSSIDDMEQAYGSSEFIDKYRQFMSIAGDHASVFGGLLGTLSAFI